MNEHTIANLKQMISACTKAAQRASGWRQQAEIIRIADLENQLQALEAREAPFFCTENADFEKPRCAVQCPYCENI